MQKIAGVKFLGWVCTENGHVYRFFSELLSFTNKAFSK